MEEKARAWFWHCGIVALRHPADANKKGSLSKQREVFLLMKRVKKLAALLLAAVVAVSATGCADQSWSVKSGDQTLAIGVYIYYELTNYQTAYYQSSDSSTPLLSQTIEEQSGYDWVKNTALENCQSWLAVYNELAKLNLLPTQEEIAQAEADGGESWSTQYEDFGISKDSYLKATSLYNLYNEKLFDAVYGENGTQPVSDEELEDYFVDNYVNLRYFTKGLTTTDEDGNSLSLSDEEIAEIKEQFEGYAQQLNNGEKSIEEIAEEYQTSEELDSSPLQEITNQLDSIGFSDTITNELQDLENNQAVAVQSGSVYYLFWKDDIASKADELQDAEQRNSILYQMKSDEYTAYVEGLVAQNSYTVNDSALNKYDPNYVEGKLS